MDKIYVAIKHITHFDWERKEIIGASYNEAICAKIIEEDAREFESFDGEYAEYWTEEIRITK